MCGRVPLSTPPSSLRLPAITQANKGQQQADRRFAILQQLIARAHLHSTACDEVSQDQVSGVCNTLGVTEFQQSEFDLLLSWSQHFYLNCIFSARVVNTANIEGTLLFNSCNLIGLM